MPEELSNSVFVSYRREVSQFFALALWQNLSDRGIDVFYDQETIHAGRFETIIRDQIAARPYMVPVLQAGVLNRCVDPNDWFRQELEAAIDLGRTLVPVYTPEFDFDDIERFLPDTTAAALRSYNMLEIPPKFFAAAVDMLAENYLKPIRQQLEPASEIAAAEAENQAAARKEAAPVSTRRLTAEEQYARGYGAQLRGEDQAAIDAYTEAVKLNPKHANAYIGRGNAKYRLGDYAGAVEDHTEAIRLQPETASAYYNRGLAQKAAGEDEAAIADYTAALELNPEHANAYIGRGLAHKALGDNDQAIADLTEAIRISPETASAHYNRGLTLKAIGDFDAATADYAEAIRINPNHDNAYVGLGGVKYARGDYEGAIADNDEALRINPDNEFAKVGKQMAINALAAADG